MIGNSHKPLRWPNELPGFWMKMLPGSNVNFRGFPKLPKLVISTYVKTIRVSSVNGIFPNHLFIFVSTHHVSPYFALSFQVSLCHASLAQLEPSKCYNGYKEGKSASKRVSPEWCLCKIPTKALDPEFTPMQLAMPWKFCAPFLLTNSLSKTNPKSSAFYSTKSNSNSFGFFDSFLKKNTKNTEAIHFLHLKLKVAKHSLLSPDSLFETFFPHAKHAQ